VNHQVAGRAIVPAWLAQIVEVGCGPGAYRLPADTGVAGGADPAFAFTPRPTLHSARPMSRMDVNRVRKIRRCILFLLCRPILLVIPGGRGAQIQAWRFAAHRLLPDGGLF